MGAVPGQGVTPAFSPQGSPPRRAGQPAGPDRIRDHLTRRPACPDQGCRPGRGPASIIACASSVVSLPQSGKSG